MPKSPPALQHQICNGDRLTVSLAIFDMDKTRGTPQGLLSLLYLLRTRNSEAEQMTLFQ